MEEKLKEAAIAWQEGDKENRAVIVLSFERLEKDKESEATAGLGIVVLGKHEDLVEAVAESINSNKSPMNRIVGHALTKNLISKLMK